MKNSAKKIAMPVLGEQATGFYQTELNRLYARGHAGDDACPLVLLETDFDRLNASLPDKYAVLKPLLGTLFEDLAETGAAIYVVPNITLHAAIDRLALPSKERAKLVHPLECAVASLQNESIDTITLAGTRHTMKSNQLAGYFEDKQITVSFPAPGDIERLDDLRRAVFAEGFSRRLKSNMDNVLDHYDNVVLACTELSMLNNETRRFDLAQLQMAAAVARL